MTDDEQLWGVASMILKQHGDNARIHVVERLGALTLQEDWDGVAVWQEIAARLQELIEAKGVIH